MEMNSVMATEIVAAEVEHIVLPQIVSIKQASRMLGLPPYYLRRLCKEVPGVAFQSGHTAPADGETATDPVCGMTVAVNADAITREYEGKSYYFCGEHCATNFMKAPQVFLEQ